MMAGAPNANGFAMMTPVAVTVVVNGTIVSAVAPAQILGGRVVAPLTPIVVRLVSSATYDAATGTIAIDRNGARIVVPVAAVENGMPYVELGSLVRHIGGSATFDSPTKTLAIVLTAAPAITTPVPYDPTAPRAEPTTVFTPAPPAAAPRRPETGVPRPRRTAIPAAPSQPDSPAPQAS